MQNSNQYKEIGSEFTRIYYSSAADSVSKVVELLSPNALCTINDEEIIGSYNWLLCMTRKDIYRFEYSGISCTYQPMNYAVLVTVEGDMKPINFWNQNVNSWVHFNETFILEKNGNNYIVTNYILKTRV